MSTTMNGKQEKVNAKVVEGGQEQEHDIFPVVVNESGSSSIRRLKRLLSGRFYARDRRKRQKLVNEFTKNQNIELKAIVRRQAEELKESKQQVYDEMKELKSRNTDLEYGLRQACVDNLTLLKAQMMTGGSDCLSHLSSSPQHDLQYKQEREYGKKKQNVNLQMLSPEYNNKPAMQ
jgi:hypothetical protein